MSTYLGRIRRVHTGWRAVPGKNIIVYDDALVQARASIWDGVAPVGSSLTRAATRRVSAAGGRKNAWLDTNPPSPEELAEMHGDNWIIPTSTIRSAVLTRRPVAGVIVGSRRLTLLTEQDNKVIDFEGQANPDKLIAALLIQALGDRFSIASKK